MGKHKIRLPGMIFAVLGAVFLIKAGIFLGKDHFAGGKKLLAETWELVEEQAMHTFLPQVFYDPEEEGKNFWDQARTFVERSLDYWNYLRAGEDVAYLEDTSTWEAIEEATHKSIADRLNESDTEVQGQPDSNTENQEASQNPETQESKNQETASQEPTEEAFTLPAQQVQLSMEKLQNFDYLLNNFFVLDPSTTINQEE